MNESVWLVLSRELIKLKEMNKIERFGGNVDDTLSGAVIVTVETFNLNNSQKFNSVPLPINYCLVTNLFVYIGCYRTQPICYKQL